MPVADAFRYLSGLGAQCVEIGVGGFPGDAHLSAADYLADRGKIDEFKGILADNSLTISAFSAHGNPIHPVREKAQKDHEAFVNACKIAEKFGVDTVVTFSGCPGDQPGAAHPNWVTCAWPPEFLDLLEWQWNEVLIPYWKETAKIAESYGVTKIALEMHPGFCCYNPRSLMRLREAVGPAIGANFDPSHLFWQGIRPSDAIKYLGDAIHYFHAKDTKVDQSNVNVNGVLETTPLDDALHRGWLFRTIGYGHDAAEWKEIISALRAVGYDGVISIEHEDMLMSINEGLERAVAFLKDMIFYQGLPKVWWV